MDQTLRRIGLLFTGFVLLAFTIFVINQTAQVVMLAGAVDPTFGKVVLWSLLLLYTTLLVTPAVLFLRLPRRLPLPLSKSAPDFPRYILKLRDRLRGNPHLKAVPLDSQDDLEKALVVLDDKANQAVRQAASTIFISTAVSQNGHLDVLLVLSAQTRMIWRIAHIYSQRPSPRDLLKLYANVAGTALISGQLNELDMEEQIEPILTNALGSFVTLVPGLQAASALVASATLSGSANAFLTLRVGMIAKRYCNAVVEPALGTLRRAATAEAAELLIGVVAAGTRHLSQAVWKAGTEAVNRTVTDIVENVKQGTDSLKLRLKAILWKQE